MISDIEEGWLLKLNRRACMCSFCGKPLSYYETKLIEAPDGNRACCMSHWNGTKMDAGCDVKDFKGLPEEEKSRFVGYSDG